MPSFRKTEKQCATVAAISFFLMLPFFGLTASFWSSIAVYFVMWVFKLGGKRAGRRRPRISRRRPRRFPYGRRRFASRAGADADTLGNEGESIVSAELAALPEDGYAVLNGVLLRVGETLSQIDHIVFSRFGVFVIETKNYSGSIYWGHQYREWIQYVGDEKNLFLNPIRQNGGHIRTLQKITGLQSEFFCNVVVFAGSATFKDIPEEVMFPNELRHFILSHSREIIPLHQLMDEVAKVHNNDLQNSPEAVRQHLDVVEKAKEKRESARHRQQKWATHRKDPPRPHP